MRALQAAQGTRVLSTSQPSRCLGVPPQPPPGMGQRPPGQGSCPCPSVHLSCTCPPCWNWASVLVPSWSSGAHGVSLGCGQSRESELFLSVARSAGQGASTSRGLSEQVGPADPQPAGSCPPRTLLCIIYSFRSFQKDLRVSSSDGPSGSC